MCICDVVHERYYRACICILMFKARGEGRDQTVWNGLLLHKYTQYYTGIDIFCNM